MQGCDSDARSRGRVHEFLLVAVSGRGVGNGSGTSSDVVSILQSIAACVVILQLIRPYFYIG